MKRRALLLLVPLLLGCGHRRPEDRVRTAFETCRTAVESGDADGAVAVLAPDFRGPEGMDRPTARLFLMGTLRRQRVGVTVLRNQIRVDGPEAFQEVEVLLTGRGSGLLPEETSRRSFQLHWREDGKAWKLVELQSPEGP